jgi:hypothetical protein
LILVAAARHRVRSSRSASTRHPCPCRAAWRQGGAAR